MKHLQKINDALDSQGAGSPYQPTAHNNIEPVQPLTRRTFIKAMSAGAATLVLSSCGGGSSAGTMTGGTNLDGSLSGNGTFPGNNDTSHGNSPNDGGSSSQQGNQAPVWAAVPTITFTQGVAASFSIAAYVSDAEGDTLSIIKNAVSLPSGVTYDPVSKSFIYDGIGALASTGGHVLTASEG